MRNFEGTVRVRIHPEKGVMLDKGVAGSTLTAADADKILALAIGAARQHKITQFNRWSFYIPKVNEALPEGALHITLKDLENAKGTARLRSGRWQMPVLVVADAAEQTPTARKSKIIDIA
jgi:hypothetical protein